MSIDETIAMSEKPLRLSIYFDGTGNNKNNDKANERHTNFARLYELDTASGFVGIGAIKGGGISNNIGN